MKSKSNFYNEKESIYRVEKRKYKRAEFKDDIYYPIINEKSMRSEKNNDKPIIKIVNISEGGIGFKSTIPLNVGDTLRFALKIGDNPSFEVLSIVRWAGFDDENFMGGCEFIMLKLKDIHMIRNYVNSKLHH